MVPVSSSVASAASLSHGPKAYLQSSASLGCVDEVQSIKETLTGIQFLIKL